MNSEHGAAPALPSLDGLPVLDQSMIDQLRQLESIRPGLLGHLFGVFERSVDSLFAELEHQSRGGMHNELRIAFHSLKGSAASLGARRFCRVAEHAELIASGEAGEQAYTQVSELMRDEFNTLKAALAAQLARSGDQAAKEASR
ncbi:MAG: Hpt domain-containing protein [Xanthomonadales bacterium]|nr:Hpt domain-containing protein [Xanthomonadales bacterium]